jgi:23S rRNA (cytidine1920-2'-O)/16S rRNA (cytidine1409-2'-O)-methyltransferase
MSSVYRPMSGRKRLDQTLVDRGLAPTRSQAESYIRLGHVVVNKKIITKAGTMVGEEDAIKLITKEQYVSRAGLKLSSVAKALKLSFKDKVVLDVGSSTGGFTDYALQHGAKKVIAVDVGTNQLHPSLRGDGRIELHEKRDIRQLSLDGRKAAADPNIQRLSSIPDIVLIDVSFISLRDVLPHIATLCGPRTDVVAMVKPQFEARESGQKHKGVIKNDSMRRKILQDFEAWVKGLFVIASKHDSDVAGAKGNRERFYTLQKIQ